MFITQRTTDRRTERNGTRLHSRRSLMYSISLEDPRTIEVHADCWYYYIFKSINRVMHCERVNANHRTESRYKTHGAYLFGIHIELRIVARTVFFISSDAFIYTGNHSRLFKVAIVFWKYIKARPQLCTFCCLYSYYPLHNTNYYYYSTLPAYIMLCYNSNNNNNNNNNYYYYYYYYTIQNALKNKDWFGKIMLSVDSRIREPNYSIHCIIK